jgi:hypothetical protein
MASKTRLSSLLCTSITGLSVTSRTAHYPRTVLRNKLSTQQSVFSFSTRHTSLASPGLNRLSSLTSNTTKVSAPIKSSLSSSATLQSAAINDQSTSSDLTSGLADEPLILDEGERQVDWTRSFHGLSAQPFSKESVDILLAPIAADDIEVKPDGIIYLPEIKYRRILNRAFGPGGWGLAPRGETIVTGKSITREYALVAHGRYCFLLFNLQITCDSH